jgi:hypothetical protein
MNEHPWVVILRRKLRERGFDGDRLEAEVNRMVDRFPFLRRRSDEQKSGTDEGVS